MRKFYTPGSLVLLVLALAASALCAGCSIQKPTDREKAVLVTVGDFTKYGFTLNPSYVKRERFSKIVFNSGNYLLQYIYQPAASEKGSIRYLTDSVQVRNKPLASTQNDRTTESMIKAVFSAEKITLREEKMTFLYGDRNKLFTIMNEAGKAVGTYIGISDGYLDCTFMIVGVLVEKTDVLDELFRAKLDAAKELFAKDKATNDGK